MSITRPIHARLAAGLAIAFAAGAAFAAGPQDTERSRADVVNETLAARAAGELAPAGEFSGSISHALPRVSTLTRRDVAAEVANARAEGTLASAGEGFDPAVQRGGAPTLVARSVVKSETLATRRAGELVPAGEGPGLEVAAETHHVPLRNASLARR